MRTALIVFAGLVLVVGVMATAPGVRAQAGAAVAMPRWEYAKLTTSGKSDFPFMWIRGSASRNEAKDPIADLVKNAAVQAFTFPTFLDEMGKEGWELVAVDGPQAFYFKRPAR